MNEFKKNEGIFIEDLMFNKDLCEAIEKDRKALKEYPKISHKLIPRLRCSEDNMPLELCKSTTVPNDESTLKSRKEYRCILCNAVYIVDFLVPRVQERYVEIINYKKE